MAKSEIPTVDNVLKNYDKDKATLGRDINGNKYALSQKEKLALKRKASQSNTTINPKDVANQVKKAPSQPKNSMNFSARADQFVKDLKEIVDAGEIDVDDIVDSFEEEFGDPDMEYKGFKKINGTPWQKVKAYYEYALANYAPKFGKKPGDLYDLFGHVLCTIEQFFDNNGRLKKNWWKWSDDEYAATHYSIKTESVNYFPY